MVGLSLDRAKTREKTSAGVSAGLGFMEKKGSGEVSARISW